MPSAADESVAEDVPEVLFVCVHNAGRSQMAAGLLEQARRGPGPRPQRRIGPCRRRSIPRRSRRWPRSAIDLSQEFPKPLSDESVRAADVVITMGCGDACPIYPGKRYSDWELEDPAGKDLETVRRIRDQIEQRVRALLDEIAPRS